MDSPGSHSGLLSIMVVDLEAADWLENHIALSVGLLNPLTLCAQFVSGAVVTVQE